MMKKYIKFLFIGTGIAVTGLIAYALLKNDREPIKVPTEEGRGEKETYNATRTPAQELIERRKKKVAEMREAKKAAQRQPEAVHDDCDNTETEETDKQAITTESELTTDSQSSESSCVAENPTKLE